MRRLKNIIWRVFQIVMIPLAIYGAMFYNGQDFAFIHNSLANILDYYLSYVLPYGMSHAPSLTLAFIPAVLAYPAPPGFAIAAPFVFGALINDSVSFVMLVILAFCLIIRMPFSKRRDRKVMANA